MIRKLAVTACLLVAVCSPVTAAEMVGVTGSRTQYPTVVEATIGDKKVSQKLTGVAMRKKLVVDVYAVGSYIDAASKVKSAEELASADVVKQLHLVLERTVSGKDMAAAFQDAIRANYPTEFKDEMEKFLDILRSHNVNEGDHVWLTHVPGFGIYVNLVGKKAEFVQNVKFAKAVWEIYFGPKNIGDNIKKGLSSRL
jgi:hypothetical protein